MTTLAKIAAGIAILAMPALTDAAVDMTYHSSIPEPRQTFAPEASLNRYDPPKSCLLPRDQWDCVVCTVYFEARNQPMIGQEDVARTILNRAADPRYPKTFCGVVWDTRGGVQYTWTDLRDKRPRDAYAWRVAVDAATRAQVPSKFGAKLMRYHERHVHPSWPGYHPVALVGDHLFFAENTR